MIQLVPPASLFDLSDIHASPFLKWAGGKTQVLRQLEPYFPTAFGHYYEPFAGSAVVFLHLRRTLGTFPASLYDANPELVNCFQIVRDSVESLISQLVVHRSNHSKNYYYFIRQLDPSALSPVERAGRFIYLNKTCYNGLYRVNRKGEFNVPVGSYQNPTIFDEINLRAVSRALAGISIKRADFSDVLEAAEPGDFIYLDPPYFTEGSGFTSYSLSIDGRHGFGPDEHRRLKEVVASLVARRCSVLVSNSDTAYVRWLYRDFDIHEIKARRFINRDSNGRGVVSEIAIVGGRR